MGGGASFDADEARRKSRKEIGQLRSLEPSAHDNSTCRVNTVHLKDTFGEIETQRGNLHRGRRPLVTFSDDNILAHRCRSAGAVHPINSNCISPQKPDLIRRVKMACNTLNSTLERTPRRSACYPMAEGDIPCKIRYRKNFSAVANRPHEAAHGQQNWEELRCECPMCSSRIKK